MWSTVVYVAVLAAACAGGAAARARAEPVPRLDLEQVLGRTVCPLAVEVDDDPLRLPRRIKFLRCERAPERQCPAGRGAVGCCRRRDARGHLTQCVEVYDKVVVQYLDSPQQAPREAARAVLQVPVGCACVLVTPTPALPEA